jgi:hypothetical protein
LVGVQSPGLHVKVTPSARQNFVPETRASGLRGKGDVADKDNSPTATPINKPKDVEDDRKKQKNAATPPS